MKTLYQFTVEDPNKNTVTFAIQRPSRAQFEEADEIQSIETYRCVRKGMPTNAMLARHYGDDGGFLTREGKKEYLQTQVKLIEIQNDYQRLSLLLGNTEDEDKKREVQQKIVDLHHDLVDVRSKLQNFESLENSVFEKTADTKARNKVVLWWITNLSYRRNDETGEWLSIFEGDTDARLDKYNEFLDSDDDFMQNVLQRFGFYVTLWFMGKANSEEDFELYAKEFEEPEEEAEKIKTEQVINESVEVENADPEVTNNG